MAQLAVTANDAKVELVNDVSKVIANPVPDTVTIIDITASPPKVIAEVEAPTSVVGPPLSVAITPDESLCAVVAVDGSNKPKESPFHNDAGKLVVFHVEGTNLAKIGELPIVHWSQGVAISDDNRTLLVSNMVERNLQVFSLDGGTLKDTGHTIPLKGGSAAVRVADKPR